MSFDWSTAIDVDESQADTGISTTGAPGVGVQPQPQMTTKIPFDWASSQDESMPVIKGNVEKQGQGLEITVPEDIKKENFLDAMARISKDYSAQGFGALGSEVGQKISDVTGITEQAQQEAMKEQNARSNAVYSVSQATGVPLNVVDQNFDDLVKNPKVTGIKGDFTNVVDILNYGIALNMPFAFLQAPAATIKGVLMFAALDKIIPTENLVPNDAPRDTKTAVRLIDLMAKGALTAGIYEKASPILDDAFERFTLNKLTDYKLPTTVTLTPAEVKDIWQTGTLTDADQKDLFNSLNLNPDEIRTAIKNGVSIKVPAQKITRIADKPYWEKLKGLFGEEPRSEVSVETAGAVKKIKAPSGLLGAPEFQKVVEAGGGRFVGYQPPQLLKSGKQIGNMIYFDSPQSGSTFVLPLEKVTPENVQAKIAKSDAEFKAAEEEKKFAPKTEAEKLAASQAGFIDANMIPGFAETADLLKTSTEELTKTLAAAKVSDPAQLTAATLRENLGQFARSSDQVEAALSDAKKVFDKSPKEKNLEFIYQMEEGAKQATPELQKVADSLRQLFDSKRAEVQALGTGKLDNFIENYFPHIWEDPNKATDVIKKILGRRGLEGPKNFLKQRTIESTKLGVEKGLVPVSYNPVDLTMLKVREMDRYLLAHKTLNTLKDEGLVKFSSGKAPEEGWTKIDDKISTVFSKDEKGNAVLRGFYYAQPDAARIINNYLKPGLRGNYFYDLFRQAGNTMNQFQLGISAFHLGFTSMDATVSRFALGLNQLFAGDVAKGLGSMASAPGAPITNFLKGDKLLKAWYGKPTDARTAIIADLMATAGGRARMDKFYATQMGDEITKAFQEGKWVSGLMKYPFALVEKISKPILEEIVPRQKMGVFFDLMNYEVEKNPDISHENLREISQRIWDSVDNRMGQLVYDNLFWSRVTKDLAMASVRSVGWNLGTIRELGGGAVDLGKIAADLVQGKKPKASYRAAYLLALPIVAGLYGIIYQYLHTGKGPTDMKDLYYPQNGRIDRNGAPQRVSLPSYMKDLYHYTQHPVQTIENKFSPVFNTMIEMLNNKDFYGMQIRNQDDPWFRQILEEGGFIAKQNIPFSVRNAMKNLQAESNLANMTPEQLRSAMQDVFEPQIGITPAPYDINLTQAEKRASEIAGGKISVGARTKEQVDKSNTRRDFALKYANSKDQAVLEKGISEGKITLKDAQKIMSDAELPTIIRMTKTFTAEEVASVLTRANDEEKKLLLPVLESKINNRLDHGVTAEEEARLEELRNRFLNQGS